MRIERGSAGSSDDVARSLQGVMDRLLVDYGDQVPPGLVVSAVARSTRLACRSEGTCRELPTLVEQIARARLDMSVGRTHALQEAHDRALLDIDLVDLTWRA
jgi:hypothetical protein